MKKGGKLSCRRDDIQDDENCIKIKCVDFEKKIFNSFSNDRCEKLNDEWTKYYDPIAKSNYWYNSETGEATWINPFSGGKSKKKKYKNKKSKSIRKRSSKSRK